MIIKLKVAKHFWGLKENDYTLIDISGDTVGDCLKHLVDQEALKKEIFDQNGKLSIRTHVFVNGEPLPGRNLSLPVREGDEIKIMVAGES
jgi:hypothetical protein